MDNPTPTAGPAAPEPKPALPEPWKRVPPAEAYVAAVGPFRLWVHGHPPGALPEGQSPWYWAIGTDDIGIRTLASGTTDTPEAAALAAIQAVRDEMARPERELAALEKGVRDAE